MAPTPEALLLLAGRIREDQAIIERLFGELDKAGGPRLPSAAG